MKIVRCCITLSAMVLAMILPAAPARAQTASPLTLTAPLDYQVIQRHTIKEGVIPVAGTVSIDCDAVEVHLVRAGAKSPWKPANLDAATHAFKLDLTSPAGGWYSMEVRAMKASQPVAMITIDHVGVGEVFVGAGQSNSTSCGGLGSKSPLDGQTKPVSGMVTTFDGKSWRIADDPQPGAHDQNTYKLGSFWPAFGDAMAAKYKVPIGVAVTGHGGTSIKAWTKEVTVTPKGGQPQTKPGELFNWTLTRMKQLGPNGFRAVLWHQGESDADMPAAAYADGLGKIIQDFRAAAGWDMPWFVAHASFRPGKPLNENGSRGGQKILWDRRIAMEGPDTDVMVGDLRDHDGKGIHFSKKGLKFHGEAWEGKISPWLDGELKK